MSMIMRTLTVAAAGFLLAGCASNTDLHSISGGECKVFERPEFAVAGRTRYDQNWIDSTIEGGVGACNWKRPAPRPPDARTALRPAHLPKPKRSVVQRLKDVVRPKPAEAAETPALVVLEPTVAPAPKVEQLPTPQIDPVDVLLGTSK